MGWPDCLVVHPAPLKEARTKAFHRAPTDTNFRPASWCAFACRFSLCAVSRSDTSGVVASTPRATHRSTVQGGLQSKPSLAAHYPSQFYRHTLEITEGSMILSTHSPRSAWIDKSRTSCVKRTPQYSIGEYFHTSILLIVQTSQVPVLLVLVAPRFSYILASVSSSLGSALPLLLTCSTRSPHTDG